MNDAGAAATARCSAGRTLLEELRSSADPTQQKPLTELSESELDDEIRRLGSRVDSNTAASTDPQR